MKSALILLSFLALSQAAAFSSNIEAYNILEDTIRQALEKIRPKLVNPQIPNINETFSNEYIRAKVILENINVKNLDKFVVQNLKATAIPLKLSNITLTWKEISGNGLYDFNGTVNIPGFNFTGYGKGKGDVVLNNVFFTIGATFEMKDKVIQIKQKGLFGFDIRVGKAKVTLESVNGSAEQGKKLGEFLSQAIPGLINDLKNPIFNKYEKDIIKAINKILKEAQTHKYNDQSLESDESAESEEITNFY